MAYTLELSQATVGTALNYIYGSEWVGQKFTTSGAFSATKIDLYGGVETWKNGGQYWSTKPEIHIFSNSGGSPGTSLGSGTLEFNAGSETTPSWCTAVMNSPIALDASTIYFIVIDPVAGASLDEWVVYGAWPGSGGGFTKSTNDGGSWTADARADVGYKIYSGSDTTPVELSVAGGFTGGGSLVLGTATPVSMSISGGFTGGGALFLLGSSAWAGNYDTKQYVVAFGNNQVWYCEV